VAQGAIRVHGLREFQRALAKADPELRKQVRDTFKDVGDIVAREGRARFVDIDVGSASGFRPVVRQRGVAVEQRRRRTTGRRGDYGALQMRRALIPALQANEERIVDEFEKALDKVADLIERG
jgi:hypothetical protein